MDEALRELLERAVAGTARTGPLALVALGGYGRGELCPRSDVDLMVLHGERRPERVRVVAERVFYPLWDAGIALGHAVRTVKQAAAEAEAGVETATALLEARHLAGEPALVEQLHTALAATLGADRAGFLERVAAADAERHVRFGSAAHLMEPDVKECAGGLRDVHSVGWAARAIGLPGPEALEAEGLLRQAEREALEAGEEFLVRVRSALHLEAGRRSDRLVLDLQPRLADAFGFGATGGLDAPDALMRALFDHARHVEHVRALAFERARAGVAVRGAEETIAPPLVAGPEGVMAAFAEWAEGRPAPAPTTLDALEETPFEDGSPWSAATLDAFLRILRAGGAGARALEGMDRVGLLSRFLPEWADVRCRPQRDPYHTFTVDVHLTRTVAEAAALLAGRSEDPAVRAAAAA
ncbi:MAG TPA: hypothetical protein VEO00_05205, partial [Actinomycetota bacterium]|nr:hypothetical protein [Actinomycetota bacterium]